MKHRDAVDMITQQGGSCGGIYCSECPFVDSDCREDQYIILGLVREWKLDNQVTPRTHKPIKRRAKRPRHPQHPQWGRV